MAICHIALGSNLGNRHSNLGAALELTRGLPGTTVRRVSSYFETYPVGGPPGQGMFLNAAAELETILSPRVLLDHLLEIESRLGRSRAEPWAARPIDLDLLLWGDCRIRDPNLTVPHPRMHFRRFVLEPLAEIAPDQQHPDGWTIRERWRRLNTSPHYLALTGPMGVGKSTVARQLAGKLGAVLIEEEFDSVRLERLYRGERDEAGPAQDFFLASRCDLLRSDRWQAANSHWLISDFWFAQSLAYAEVLSGPEGRIRHQAEVVEAAAQVISPSLVVWLDAPPAELYARVRGRGRDFESPVDASFLAQLQAGYNRVLTGPLAPPYYRPSGQTVVEIVQELLLVAGSIAGAE